MTQFHNPNPDIPVEGPRGITAPSTLTELLLNTFPCSCSNLTVTESEDPNSFFYVSGRYENGNSLIIYNSDGSLSGITLPSINDTSDGFILKYNSLGIAQWATIIGNGYPEDIITDSYGNVYVTGDYNSNSLIIYNANGNSPIASGITLESPYNKLGYIVKYNSVGIAQWATNIVSSNDIAIINVSVDSDQNVYITGVYGSNIPNNNLLTFYNANGNTSITSGITLIYNSSGYARFIAKYNSLGQAQWATQITGTSVNNLIVNGISVDSNQNVYVTGNYNSDLITIYNSDSTDFTRMNGNEIYPSMFIVKYNANGQAQWVTNAVSSTTPNSTYGRRISIDSDNNIYISGNYFPSVDNILTFYNASETSTIASGINLTYKNERNIFIVKYNTNGQAQWATQITTDDIYDMRIDSNKNIYIVGYIYNNMTSKFYNASGSIFGQFITDEYRNGYIVKYNTNGEGQWLTRIGSTEYADTQTISIDSNQNVYVSGGYITLANIYSVDGSFTRLEAVGDSPYDGYIVKYTKDGQAQWTARMNSYFID